MKVFKNKNDKQIESGFNVAMALKSMMDEKATGLRQNATLGRSIMAGESLDGVQGGTDLTSLIETSFASSGLIDLVKDHFGTDNDEDPRVIASLNHAAETFAVMTDPKGFVQNSFSAPQAAGENTTVVAHSVPGIDSFKMIKGEGFEKMAVAEQIHIATVISALSTNVNSFTQLFFPAVSLPAGKTAVNITVRTPYAYTIMKRSATGGEYLEKENRRQLKDAYRDHTILASNNGRIYPVITSATAPASLAPAAQIPNETQTLDGVEFQTRPILFGQKVDLLAVTNLPAVHGTDGQDQTDVLDRNANMSEVYLQFVKGGNTIYVQFDISTLPGVNFTPVSEGDKDVRTFNFSGVVPIRSDMRDASSADINAAVTFRASGGVTGTDEWDGQIQLDLTGSIDGVGQIRCNEVEASWAAFRDQGVDVTDTVLETVRTEIAITAHSYHVHTTRTGSNQRNPGRIIDAGTPHTYMIPVHAGTPLSTWTPYGEQGEININELARSQRVIDSNNATITILDFERMLARSTNLPSNATTVGSQLVTPYYLAATLDADALIRINESTIGMDCLRGGVTDALTLMADQLAERSGYISAVELDSGSPDNFRTIIGTNPWFANLVILPGEGKALGGTSRFAVGVNHDNAFQDRFYVSFQRTDVVGPNPLSFGFMAQAAPVIYNNPIAAGTANVMQLQMIPRTRCAVTLPVLGVLTVTNHQSLFYTEA